MHSRISNTSKTSQNSSLPTTASILQPRDFGVDASQQETPITEERDLEAEYERSKKMSRNWADIPIFPPEPPPNIQAKLSVGQPNDKYEQEADNVATTVVNEINTPSFPVYPTHGHPLIQSYTTNINTPRQYHRPKLQRVENPTPLPEENRPNFGLHPEVIENYLRRKESGEPLPPINVEQNRHHVGLHPHVIENYLRRKESGEPLPPINVEQNHHQRKYKMLVR
jgi:hypothetical protein